MLKGYKSKIQEVQQLIDKMERGELSVDQLIDLERCTRELHERSIILKYKAFEEQSPPESVAVQEESTPIAEPEEKEVEGFSLFDLKEQEPEVGEAVLEDTPEKEAGHISEEVEVKEKGIQSVEEPPAAITDETTKENAPELTGESIEKETTTAFKGVSLLEQLNIPDNSIGSQWAGRKLDTLIGAFGLNERLRYINELFDGNGEAFSDAIKILDGQASMQNASLKIEEIASQNSWDLEEETVLEFMTIVRRRYV